MIELEMVETTYLDRARENSIRFGNGSPARGRVFRDPAGIWHSVVFCQGKLVLYDNCVSLSNLQDYCRRDVGVANRMVWAGHGFQKSYPQILREGNEEEQERRRV